VEEWDYAFDPQKNAWLIRERRIGFEQIIALIDGGKLIQVLEHHNAERYPNQLLYEVDVDGYVHVVPVVGKAGRCFLKRFIRAERRPGNARKESPHEKARILR
jgi:hypothetical protein